MGAFPRPLYVPLHARLRPFCSDNPPIDARRAHSEEEGDMFPWDHIQSRRPNCWVRKASLLDSDDTTGRGAVLSPAGPAREFCKCSGFDAPKWLMGRAHYRCSIGNCPYVCDREATIRPHEQGRQKEYVRCYCSSFNSRAPEGALRITAAIFAVCHSRKSVVSDSIKITHARP